ncbi:MAG TPA: 4'-phosphopantetheinyl transferase superfamily protein [Gaiellaceae bacterium]|nr:4'-phosphopantetheinyl transferase superfamily protein [Gaiellaceae bacterium]
MAPDEVRVWVAPLDVGDCPLGELEADLSTGERERASRLRFERDRHRFVAAHAFLRRVLAHSLGCAAPAVPIVRGAGGKPELASTRSGSRATLRFNLAHSGELVVCATALEREVGIDVERVRPVRGLDGLARRVLSEREQAAFRARSGGQADEAFLTAWTRKEAVLKARGEGLGCEPASVEVAFGPGEPARLLAVAGEPGAELRWTLQALDAGPGHVAAVAAEGDGWLVRRRFCAGAPDVPVVATVSGFS